MTLSLAERALTLLSQHEYITYLIVFLASFLESALFMGFLIPGETIVVLSGFLAFQGHVNLGDCIAIIALGAISGDSVGYFIGKAVGRGYFERHKSLFLIKERHVRKTDAYFQRHGGKTVFIGRFVGFLRTMAPFAAGMSEMPYRKFLSYNVLGGIIWAATFTLVGYFFRESWDSIGTWLSRTGAFALFAVMLLACLGFLYMTREKRQELFWALLSKGVAAFIFGATVTGFFERHPALLALAQESLSSAGYVALHFRLELALSTALVWIFA